MWFLSQSYVLSTQLSEFYYKSFIIRIIIYHYYYVTFMSVISFVYNP